MDEDPPMNVLNPDQYGPSSPDAPSPALALPSLPSGAPIVVATLDAMSDADWNQIAAPVFASKRGAAVVKQKQIMAGAIGGAAGLLLGVLAGKVLR